MKHHHAQRDGRNGANQLRHDSAGKRNPRRSDLVLLLLFRVGVWGGLHVFHT
jgi:hypothetical protein